jgi:hypothetical protein
MRVEMLRPTADGEVRIETIAERDVLQSPLVSSPGRLIGVLTDRFAVDLHDATSELVRREQFLERLRRMGLGRAATLRQALENYLGS